MTDTADWTQTVTLTDINGNPAPTSAQADSTDDQNFSSGGNTGTHNTGVFNKLTVTVFSIEISWLASASSLGGTLTEPFVIQVNDSVAGVSLAHSVIWCPVSASAFALSDRVIVTWANGYLLETPLNNSQRLTITWANTVTNWTGAGVNVNSIITYHQQ